MYRATAHCRTAAKRAAAGLLRLLEQGTPDRAEVDAALDQLLTASPGQPFRASLLGGGEWLVGRKPLRLAELTLWVWIARAMPEGACSPSSIHARLPLQVLYTRGSPQLWKTTFQARMNVCSSLSSIAWGTPEPVHDTCLHMCAVRSWDVRCAQATPQAKSLM